MSLQTLGDQVQTLISGNSFPRLQVSFNASGIDTLSQNTPRFFSLSRQGPFYPVCRFFVCRLTGWSVTFVPCRHSEVILERSLFDFTFPCTLPPSAPLVFLLFPLLLRLRPPSYYQRSRDLFLFPRSMITSTSTMQNEQRGFPNLPRLENNHLSDVPSRDADRLCWCQSRPKRSLRPLPTQDEDPSDPMYTRSDTLHKHSGALLNGGPNPSRGLPQQQPWSVSHKGRSTNGVPSSLGMDTKNQRRTYFNYGISAMPYPSYDATSDTCSKKSSRNPSTLYSMYTPLIPHKSCALSSELPSPSHARFPTHEKDVLITITVSSPSRSLFFFHSQPFWLTLYFCFNLGLTLYNKGVFIPFPYTYSLTAIHSFFGTIGGIILLQAGVFTPAKLFMVDNLVLVHGYGKCTCAHDTSHSVLVHPTMYASRAASTRL